MSNEVTPRLTNEQLVEEITVTHAKISVFALAMKELFDHHDKSNSSELELILDRIKASGLDYLIKKPRD